MIVKLNLHNEHLLQSVRLTQAVAEAGLKVHVPKQVSLAYLHIAKFFPLDMTAKEGVPVDCEVNHAEPFSRIGSIKRPLIFPTAITKRYRDFWSDARSGVLFRGFLPEHRKGALGEWQGKATIEATDKGRRGLQRYWDEDYSKALGGAEFALCPNGGFPWTYRVIEACLLGATPIVQEKCDWYEGMYYCDWDGPLERRNVEENYEWAVRLVTLTKDQIIANLFDVDVPVVPLK